MYRNKCVFRSDFQLRPAQRDSISNFTPISTVQLLMQTTTIASRKSFLQYNHKQNNTSSRAKVLLQHTYTRRMQREGQYELPNVCASAHTGKVGSDARCSCFIPWSTAGSPLTANASRQSICANTLNHPASSCETVGIPNCTALKCTMYE